MACRYFFEGKEYDATQFREVLKGLPVERMAKYVPEARASMPSNVISAPDRFLKEVFRAIPDVSDKQAAQLMRVHQEKPLELKDALSAAMKPGMLDKFLEAWKAGMVSAPGTWAIANPLGNTGDLIMRLGETATSSALDSFIGGPKTRLRGEARFELAGALKGANEAIGRLGADLKDIFTLAPEQIKLDRPIEYQVGKIGGKFGRAVRIPFRLLGAFDDFAKEVGGRAELYKLAYRRAKGNDFVARKIIDSPPADIAAAVAQSRLERTFNDPHRLAQALVRMRSDHKWLHAVFPFIQTPANILKVSLERSPIGFVEGAKAYRAYREGLRKGLTGAELETLKGTAVDKLARPLMGTLLLGAFGAYAKAGGMTGNGPADRDEKNALLNSGWQPYSFKVPTGDGKFAYVPFNRFEPVSAILGFSADLAEITDAKEGAEVFEKALGSIGQNLTSKSYLRGLADASQFIANPQQFGTQYVKNLAGSLVPNVVAKVAQAADPTFRDTKATNLKGAGGIVESVGKTIATDIPGLSRMLPAKRTATGEEAERPGNPLTRFALPSQLSQDKEGKELEREFARIGYVPNTPGRTVAYRGKKYELNDEEYGKLRDADLRAAEMARKVMRSPAYKNLPDTIEEGGQRSKEAILRSYFERARSEMRRRLTPSAVRRASL